MVCKCANLGLQNVFTVNHHLYFYETSLLRHEQASPLLHAGLKSRRPGPHVPPRQELPHVPVPTFSPLLSPHFISSRNAGDNP